MFIVGKTKTYFLQCKNHLFARQKPYFSGAKTTLLTSKRVVSVFYEFGNRNTKLIEICCRQTNFANGWLLFPYSIAALLWLILLCASCPLLCKCLCSWRLHDDQRGRNVEHLHWFRVRLPTLLLCHRLWLLLPY